LESSKKSFGLPLSSHAIMAIKKHVTREDIIKTLASSLSPLDYVHAFWEGGAPAFGRLDEWSDLDLYVVVDDEKV